MILNLLIVAVGSGAGGLLRYGVSLLARTHPSVFPYWTFAVNVLGSFLIGLFVGLLGSDWERGRLLLITGFCGGFTTFSAFSFETLELIRQGSVGWAFANIVISIVGAVGACWIGYQAGK